MIAICRFLMKKIIKNKLNLFVFLLMICVVSITFYFNARTATYVSLDYRIEKSIHENEPKLIEHEKELETLDKNSEEYSVRKSTLERQKEYFQRDTQILEALKKKQWDLAYHLQFLHESENYQVASNEPNVSKELVTAINREKQKYSVLSNLNIQEHSLDYPTYGIDNVIWITTYIFPTIFILCIIFVLSQLFTSRFKGNLDSVRLLPCTHWKYTLASLIVAITYSLVFLGIVLVIGFILASLDSGVGSLIYPYLFFDVEDKVYYFKPIMDILFPSVLLLVLSLIIVVQFVYFVGLIFKNNLLTLFISILTVLGTLFGIHSIQPIQTVAQLLPFTYLRAFDVSSGILSKTIDNKSVNFETGLLVLLVSIVILSIILFVCDKINSVNKVKNKI